MTPPPFRSTEHLSTEALAAYVDEALPATGRARASAHLERCAECRAGVAAQRTAREALRRSGPVEMPPELRDRLTVLPDVAPPRRLSDATDRPSGLLARLRRSLRGPPGHGGT